MNQHYKTWIELHRASAEHNIRAFRSILKIKTKLFAVVKSNAYGHGLREFSMIANRGGVDGFCVDSVVEGHVLRTLGIKKPILVLGPTFPWHFALAASDALTLTISHMDALKTFFSAKISCDFHLKLDTGMHRQGFYLEDLPKVIQLLKTKNSKQKAHFKGVYTHFAAAKDITYPHFTLGQIEKFERGEAMFRKAGFKHLLRHASATGGAVLYPRAHFDAVRIGIGLYGYWPTRETKMEHPLILGKELSLEPVLRWYALVSETKRLSPGDFVGYDLTERVSRATRAAIVPIGYWHGFPRTLSHIGEIAIGKYRARVLGRVSMDLMTCLLPPRARVEVGAKAILVDGKTLDAETIASRAGTIHYEFLTRINPLIKRVVV